MSNDLVTLNMVTISKVLPEECFTKIVISPCNAAKDLPRSLYISTASSLEHILANEKDAAQSGSYLDRLFLQREKRIFMNQTALQLRAVKGDNLRKYRAPKPGLASSLKGESGSVALINVDDFARADAIMEFNRLCLVGASTTLDLRAYRSKNGQLPENLDGLKKMGLKVPGDALIYDRNQKTLTVKAPQDVLGVISGKDFALPGWSEVTSEGLRLSI